MSQTGGGCFLDLSPEGSCINYSSIKPATGRSSKTCTTAGHLDLQREFLADLNNVARLPVSPTATAWMAQILLLASGTGLSDLSV